MARPSPTAPRVVHDFRNRASTPTRTDAATARGAVRFATGGGTDGLVAPPLAGLAHTELAATRGNTVAVVALTAIPLLLLLAGLSLTSLSRGEARHAVSHRELMPAPAHLMNPAPAQRLPIFEVPGTVVDRDDSAAGANSPVKEKPTAAERAEGDSGNASTLIQSGKGLPGQGIALAGAPAPPAGSPTPAVAGRRSEKVQGIGRELFERVWVMHDPRAHGGDGLGPVFNAQSCVGCHNLGGSGGAGKTDANVQIATVTGGASSDGKGNVYSFSTDFGAGMFERRRAGSAGAPALGSSHAESTFLPGIHQGFRDSDSVVLHRYGTDPAYNSWRASVPGKHGPITINNAERNTPALFGAGLIDAIPDDVIESAARRKSAGPEKVEGRVSRLKDGRVGRFGWKAQTATLAEFVRAAAAGEIGLELPGRHQSADPRAPGLAPTGLDMNESECDALIEYVRGLPAPVTIKPAGDMDAAQCRAGEATFRSIGCTACHTPNLGGVEGIYSDLLLHDMGPQLGGSGAAYTASSAAEPPPTASSPAQGRARADGSTTSVSVHEWRTPPLWGVRDSGPYLHDGRAAGIDQAIMMHSGRGAAAARRYAELSPRRRQPIEAFLWSLAAPSADR